VADLRPPNGFAVQVLLGWRSVEAKFLPDNFAGDVIRSMGESSPVSRALFARTAEALSALGARVAVRVNDSGIPDVSLLPPSPWSRFELSVFRMSDARTTGTDALLRDAADVAGTCLALVLALLPIEDDAAESAPLFEGGLPEGAKTRVEVNRYERNPVNRAACISRHGAVCAACGFDFGTTYGPLGEGYIEVHHVIPVSRMGSEYSIDPVRDLIPLCANCHRIVHRQDPPMAVAALQLILRKPDAEP
jgi:5-methylcytosine-specific restriction protein A